MRYIRRLLIIISIIAICTASMALMPVAAAPPSIGSVNISPDPAYTDIDLLATPSDDWSDLDDDPEGYQFQWQIYDGAVWNDISGATTDMLASTNFDVGDQIKVICTPDDGLETGTPVEATITISNGIVTISPDPAYADTPLVATLLHWPDVYDSFTFQWQLYDGVVWNDISGATTDMLDIINFGVGDQVKVICTPYIGLEAGDPVESEITVSDGIVILSPDPAYTDSTLLATPLHWPDIVTSFTFQWQLYDGAFWNDIYGATTDTLDSSNFVKDYQVKVICIPYAGEVAGVPMEATITISNSPPSVTGVIISPDPADTASTLEATPEDLGWYDADGDPEGYLWQWQIWDESTTGWLDISGANTDTLDNSNFILNDQIKIICTPFDGTDFGDPVEATVTISLLNYDSGVDVKPGSDENPINLKSKGVIPVAIYTTEGFDATTVDPSTVKFGPSEASPVHYAFEDVDEDGDVDMILHFRTQSTGISVDDTEVTLTGETDSGVAFIATNAIKIVPPNSVETITSENSEVSGPGNESAPGQNKEPGENAEGKAVGQDSAPGQNKEPGESAEGKAKGKDSVPGQNKQPGEPSTGKAKGKNN